MFIVPDILYMAYHTAILQYWECTDDGTLQVPLATTYLRGDRVKRVCEYDDFQFYEAGRYCKTTAVARVSAP